MIFVLPGRARDWLLGAVPLAILLVLIDRSVGWSELFRPWRTFPLPLLGVLLTLTAVSQLTRALRIQVYFGPALSGRFFSVLRLSLLHTAGNVLLPMRLGEVLFPWLMRRYFGHDPLAAAAALLWLRLLDLHFIALLGWGLLWLRQPAPWWPGLAVVWLAALPGLAWLGTWAAQRPPQLGTRHYCTASLRFIARAAPQTRGVVTWLYLWTACAWLAKFVAFAALLRQFMPIEWWRALVGAMGAELSSILPLHGIAGAGSYELATVAALAPLGVNPAVALAGAVNLHLFMLGSNLLGGAVALLLPRASCSTPTAR